MDWWQLLLVLIVAAAVAGWLAWILLGDNGRG